MLFKKKLKSKKTVILYLQHSKKIQAHLTALSIRPYLTFFDSDCPEVTIRFAP